MNNPEVSEAAVDEYMRSPAGRARVRASVEELKRKKVAKVQRLQLATAEVRAWAHKFVWVPEHFDTPVRKPAKLPKLVTLLTQVHDAWVVGSAAAPNADLANVKDFDILVSFSHWPAVAALIPDNARRNTFGGWKCESDGRSVDVWPDDMARFLANQVVTYAWHPRTGIRFRKE